ncbi:MAG: hypothetical protein SWO11_05150 [Thermodesulfobacteriota bacterium]|nr:hypothetical protein [Thermodesulfobacteriota bacterium]
MDHKAVNKRRHIIRLIWIFTGLLAIIGIFLIGGGTYLLFKYSPTVLSIIQKPYSIEKTILGSVDSELPVTAYINETLTFPFQTNIHFSIPFKTTFIVPIRHTFIVPFEKPVHVKVDHIFHINENIHFNTEIPMDTEFQTNIFGLKRTLPVKGSILLDQDVPIKHGIRIKDDVIAKPINPIEAHVEHLFEVPVDIIVEGSIPIDEEFPVQFNVALDQGLTVTEKVPGIIAFDIAFDLKKGFIIEQQ